MGRMLCRDWKYWTKPDAHLILQNPILDLTSKQWFSIGHHLEVRPFVHRFTLHLKAHLQNAFICLWKSIGDEETSHWGPLWAQGSFLSSLLKVDKWDKGGPNIKLFLNYSVWFSSALHLLNISLVNPFVLAIGPFVLWKWYRYLYDSAFWLAFHLIFYHI